MKAQVYAMHIAYNGFEDKIWRTVEVSSKYTIAQLGYLILHTFDTLAYHAFEFSFKDTPYVLPMILDECDIENAVGSICGAPTVSCPPAIPIAVSGEEITPEAIAMAKSYGIRSVSVLK